MKVQADKIKLLIKNIKTMSRNLLFPDSFQNSHRRLLLERLIRKSHVSQNNRLSKPGSEIKYLTV